MTDLKLAAQKALAVLEEIALDLVNAELTECRQKYAGGYKPRRIAAAEAEVTTVTNTIADLRSAIQHQEEREPVQVSEYIIDGDPRRLGSNDIRIARAKQMEGPAKWAVRRVGECLNKAGEWEYEPMPSSREDDFLARCRFDSPAEAIRAAIATRQGEKP